MIGSKIYHFVRAAKKDSQAEKMDAEPIKRGTAFCIQQFADKHIEAFSNAMDVVVNHHFNDHEKCCSSWCVRKEDMAREAMARGEIIVPRKPGL
jgi:hypothetical protein